MKTIFAWLISLMLFGSGLAYAGDYTDSAHGNSSSGVDRTTIDSDYDDYSPGNCAHCHEAHASLDGSEPTPVKPGPDEALLFEYEEDLCETCHDGNPAADDIQAQIDKDGTTDSTYYAHPTDDNDYSGVHKVSESTTTNMDPDDYADDQSARHAECVDCHNPHAAESTVHTQGTNAVSSTSPIYKVSGVSPPSTSAWATPSTSYTEKPTSTGIDFEYELCFKCHSNWTDQPAAQTNTAFQFNPANASFHPVELNLGHASSGSSPLDADQMLAPWKVGTGTDTQGTKTMYCSDCHGDDAASPPAGPHGSGSPKILKGRWPDNSSGVLWTISDADETKADNFDTECLCLNCHPVFPWQNNAHSNSSHDGDYCIECHVGVPHGSSLGRLIADVSDPAPYDYNNSYADVTNFNKAATPTGYNRTTTYCTANCGGASTH